MGISTDFLVLITSAGLCLAQIPDARGWRVEGRRAAAAGDRDRSTARWAWLRSVAGRGARGQGVGRRPSTSHCARLPVATNYSQAATPMDSAVTAARIEGYAMPARHPHLLLVAGTASGPMPSRR